MQRGQRPPQTAAKVGGCSLEAHRVSNLGHLRACLTGSARKAAVVCLMAPASAASAQAASPSAGCVVLAGRETSSMRTALPKYPSGVGTWQGRRGSKLEIVCMRLPGRRGGGGGGGFGSCCCSGGGSSIS